MEQEMLAEARAEADAEMLAGWRWPGGRRDRQRNWHPGIVGLLASRLKDHARRPAFAIAFNPNGVGTGSGPLGLRLRSRATGARGRRRRA